MKSAVPHAQQSCQAFGPHPFVQEHPFPIGTIFGRCPFVNLRFPIRKQCQTIGNSNNIEPSSTTNKLSKIGMKRKRLEVVLVGSKNAQERS